MRDSAPAICITGVAGAGAGAGAGVATASTRGLGAARRPAEVPLTNEEMSH